MRGPLYSCASEWPVAADDKPWWYAASNWQVAQVPVNIHKTDFRMRRFNSFNSFVEFIDVLLWFKVKSMIGTKPRQ